MQWLSRDLDEAMLAFVRKARSGDAIRGCFYEFSYGPVLAELAAAIKRGVDVKLVVDCKVNEHTVNEKQPDGTRKPVFYESSPRLTNLAAIAEAELPPTAIIRREARRSAIAHNKFMVLLTGNPRTPNRCGPARPTSPKEGSTARPMSATGSEMRRPRPSSTRTGSSWPPTQAAAKATPSRRAGTRTVSSTRA